ncbi:MAG: chitobiase/beta-hexosaminidase C-terminal domain-containing protein [Oscillospiraceae bacterium]|nr:chitobiase/beta-hexosaminidase C-terminal domain-containing protein [Oscillospiraceae bacterium]
MAINLASKYANKLDERFTLGSVTEKFAGKAFDWDGVKSLKVYSAEPVTMGDYNRAGGSRFGTAEELGDAVQVMTMSRDRAFTFTIDAGNAAEQLNVKHCNRQLKSSWDEVVIPEIDIYRLDKWANGAGLGCAGADALTKDNAVTAIMTANAAMSNARVPRRGRALFIGESAYISCKLASELMSVDTLGAQSVKNGVVGFIDGAAVVPVPDSYMPQGVSFILKHAGATADPQKLKTLRAHKNPPGLDGDLGECRIMYDSFVLDSKVCGVYVYATEGVAAPVITVTDGNAAITCVTDGAEIVYTTDGTNPKTSSSAKTYSSAVTVDSSTVIRAYARLDGAVNSAVAEAAAE